MTIRRVSNIYNILNFTQYIYVNSSNWTTILIISLTYPKVFSYLNPITGPVWDECQRLTLNKNNNKPSRFSWEISFVAVQQRPARYTYIISLIY